MLEIGAGTGSATNTVLPELPEGGFDYTYTDISAGFFAEAEARFGDGGGCIEYRPLDIEKDPVAQGFDSHGYDLLIASNVLHATRYLGETLGHCLDLHRAGRPTGGAGEPQRPGLDGPDVRTTGRLVALCRRLPAAPRTGESGRVAAGAG